MANEEELAEMRNVFHAIDLDNSDLIDQTELKTAFDQLNLKIPGFRVRQIVTEIDKNEDDKISWEEFQELVRRLKQEQGDLNFTTVLRPRSGLEYHTGMTQASAEGTTHSVSKQEQIAFGNWIMRSLKNDVDCMKYLPFNPSSNEMFSIVNDGIIICKMINIACPDTIDERVINRGTNLSIFKKQENHTLALISAESIGCYIVNIRADDLIKGKPHLILGLLWQIIKVGLLGTINCKQLGILLRDDETIEDLQSLSPEEILLRWVNYHLEGANTDRRCTNFSGDIMDSEVYLHLLQRIAPPETDVYTAPIFGISDLRKRAENMLQEAGKLDCRAFVTPQDVVSGNAKLNLAFVAYLFNHFPALDVDGNGNENFDIEEDREEKRFRNWMNSLGLPRYVYYMYSDLCDGILLLRMFDRIKAKTVDWTKVNMPPFKFGSNMKKIENCNYCIALGHDFKFSLVGIDGKDMAQGQKNFTLALVWQMMRAYTLALLTKLDSSGKPIREKEIVAWANTKFTNANLSHEIKSFGDKKLTDSKILLDLINILRPNIVNYDYVREETTEEVLLLNAKYTLTLARKIGAHVYALPEDIVFLNSKMILTIFAALMLVDVRCRDQAGAECVNSTAN